MKKTLAATTAFLTICSSAFAALPPGVFTSQKPAGPAPHPPFVSSQRVHVNPSQRFHTPTGNRVRMTPTHGELGPVAGRMSSTARVSHHGGPASVHVGTPPGPASGPRYDRVYVHPSLPPHHYYHPVPPLPPPRWRYAGYYRRPYGYSSVWFGYPIAYYGYPYSIYYSGYYVRPGVRISVRL